ncbi:MAG: hypothetical protein JOZ07_05005 [Solirubrobacterales bacterium]|nr:hypothetical protein [Solirubrobacterales bacterium]
MAASVRGEAAGGRASAQPPSGPLADVQKLADERPEVAVGAAFGGGLVLAMILRRLAR